MAAANHNTLAQNRKDDHIRFALEQQTEIRRSDFHEIEFLHHALAGGNSAEVNLATKVGELNFPVPFYINAMTGGTDTAMTVNRTLALAAAEVGVPLASGSLGVAVDQPATAASFQVLRELNPHGLVFANLGAGRNATDALRAVELLQADALQIHVNAVQETVMPEGDRDFSGWLRNIEAIVAALEPVGVPVIVKEVGFGLSRKTLEQLRGVGVTIADVSGSGGTNFARIEAGRRADVFTDFNDFGQSAIVCLLDAPEFPNLLASGGVKTPLDAIKLLALGAKAVGIAGYFLRVASSSDSEQTAEQLKWWIARLREMYALLGAASTAELQQTDLLLRGRVREYCQLREIDPAGFARRSQAR